MKFYALFISTILLFSCQDQASSNKDISTKKVAEIIQTKTPTIPEASATAKSDVPQAKAINANAATEKATEMKTEKPPSAQEQAGIDKIIENATATKPIAIPKGAPKPSVKEASKPVVKTEKPVVAKTEQSKPIAIETTQPTATSKPAPQKETKISHAAFDSYLKKYVSGTGMVNYGGMKSDYQPLKNYLNKLAESTPKSDWSRNEKLAYWINAYNAYTIDLILSNYPVSKITDLDGGSPWKVSRIELEGKKYSLDQIENQIIRPQFNEPRIHFAVNCAAKSCPTLMNGAFLPSKLSRQLESQTKMFINNSAFNNITEGSAKVSKIFEWYGEDFGDLRNYLNKYSNQQIAKGTKIEFNEYDWSLNDK